MWKPIALVACCAMATTPFALADEGNPSATPAPVAVPASCTPLSTIYSRSNWRDAHPLRGETPCEAPNARKLRRDFYLYRHYRRIAPYRCHGGDEGYYAIPCYIIACESHFSWRAANPSGAVGVYQLLGWGAPYPARTFAQRVRNHEIAASLSLSSWVCA